MPQINSINSPCFFQKNRKIRISFSYIRRLIRSSHCYVIISESRLNDGVDGLAREHIGLEGADGAAGEDGFNGGVYGTTPL
jgi:hypothetical protein